MEQGAPARTQQALFAKVDIVGVVRERGRHNDLEMPIVL